GPAARRYGRSRHGGPGLPGPGQPGLPQLPGRLLLSGASAGRGRDPMTGDEPPHGPRYSPVQLARLLGLPEPTAEQAAVIAAPLRPVAVIAGAGSGNSATTAAGLVWLVADGRVQP